MDSLENNLDTKLKKYRLSQKEYELANSLVGREIQGVEWALFSALWSEHCSYKSSKVHFKKFYSQNKNVLVSEGENSGVLDLGQGERICFKMESHNHPSFIEPYHGAATGIGGVLRDIFTMGARPVLAANYLCFGELEAPRMKDLVRGVAAGIGGYGKGVGVPTVTGFTEFHSSYNGNILVNAFALGVLKSDEKIVLSKAQGAGNLVVYVGARTGRDGIHGASMASESFNQDSNTQKPIVQVGDPFVEKCLIESCLEVIHSGKVVAIQDMGAAGLTSSSFEMASNGGVGLELNLDQVPLRDTSLTPEDILLSESQERMLLICEPQNLEAIQSVFYRWGLEAVVIGKVLDQKNMRLLWHGELLTEIDPGVLVESAPRYERPFKEYSPSNRGPTELEIFEISETLSDILVSDFGSSKNWIYRQYGQRVGGLTARDCSHSIGVVQLEESQRALGLSMGCRPYLMRLDPRLGALDAIYHPALQLASKGFLPMATTDCLNFGNPENPEIMTEFVVTVEALSEACQKLDAPIISGNVSFYNETKSQNITSTPSIGLVGLRESMDNIPKESFQKENAKVYLLYEHEIETGGALQELYTKSVTASEGDLKNAPEFIKKIREISFSKEVLSSRVVGKFGLLYAATLMASESLELHLTERVDFLKTNLDLFKERLYEVLVEVWNPSVFEAELQKRNIKFVRLGSVQKISEETKNLKERYNNIFEERI